MQTEQQQYELAELKKKSSEQKCKTPKDLRDKYRFIEKLGSGTQGNVYKAERLSDGLIVAIKKLRIDSVNTWKEYDLFHREADVLATIHEHGVAEFYETLEFLNPESPAAYIVQELIEGRSLQYMLQVGFRFTVSRIFKMAYDLVCLLERLHAHNPPIIHRDIKPNNIIMKPLANSDDFDPYLIDFGAVANPTVQKGGSTLAGTYGYMPPEQLVGRPVPASDIYSLGVTIVYMLCGVEPVNMRTADFRLIIDPHLENVPRPIVSVLHQMLDPRPETRLCDYDKLKSIFEQFANDIYVFDDEGKQLSEELINQQLSHVNAFNQAGNLDLWMRLPESMPRPVPTSFADTILNLANMNDNRRLRQRAISRGVQIGLTVAVTIIALAVISAFSDVGKLISRASFAMDKHSARGFLLLVILVIIAVYLLITSIDLIGCLSKIRKNKSEIKSWLKDYNCCQTPSELVYLCGYERQDDIPILTLLKFGRKAIATIVDFEDIPVIARHCELSESGQIVSRSRVPFRLRYRFNPPDDASADDLVHEVTIYNHQTEGLEQGTPIPILYYINPEDNSDVMSIPYPFPFTEIKQTQLTLVNKVNLYCRTKGIV